MHVCSRWLGFFFSSVIDMYDFKSHFQPMRIRVTQFVYDFLYSNFIIEILNFIIYLWYCHELVDDGVLSDGYILTPSS
jgi:hypothetical protein